MVRVLAAVEAGGIGMCSTTRAWRCLHSMVRLARIERGYCPTSARRLSIRRSRMTLPRLLWGIVARPVKTLDAFDLHDGRLRLRRGLMAYGAGGALGALLELPRALSTNSPYPWALPILAV